MVVQNLNGQYQTVYDINQPLEELSSDSVAECKQAFEESKCHSKLFIFDLIDLRKVESGHNTNAPITVTSDDGVGLGVSPNLPYTTVSRITCFSYVKIQPDWVTVRFYHELVICMPSNCLDKAQTEQREMKSFVFLK